MLAAPGGTEARRLHAAWRRDSLSVCAESAACARGESSAVNAAALQVEEIRTDDELLALVIRDEAAGDGRMRFYTPSDLNVQVGSAALPGGGAIPRHIHRAVERTITGTTEVIVVQAGTLRVDFFSTAREFVCSREITVGDLVITLGGGHGYTALSEARFLEVKQGPYVAEDDKVRF